MNIDQITIDTAEAYINSQSITIIPGKAYNIYLDGCVYQNEDDPNNLHWSPEKKQMLRCCPEHSEYGLLNKFKKCACDQVYFSSRVRSSENCNVCYWGKNKKDRVKKNYRKIKKILNNSDMADLSRWDCSFRSDCLTKYIKYNAVPCKDCQSYTKANLGMDPMASTHHGGSLHMNPEKLML